MLRARVAVTRVAISDLLVIIWAVVGAQLIRFGPDPVNALQSTGATSSVDLKYTAFSVVLIGTWVLMLRLHGAYDRRLLGHGPKEYKVVGDRGHLLELIRALNSVPAAGYRVVAACCGDAKESHSDRVPVLDPGCSPVRWPDCPCSTWKHPYSPARSSPSLYE